MFLGTTLATVPAALWMAARGRRTGFVGGALVGALGGLVAAGGIALDSLIVFSLGTLLVGAYQGAAQFYRFAASEVADDAFRSRAISLVLAGGVVAALLGPALGKLGAGLLEPMYAGSFLLLALTSLLAAGLLLRVRVPMRKPSGTRACSGRERPVCLPDRAPVIAERRPPARGVRVATHERAHAPVVARRSGRARVAPPCARPERLARNGLQHRPRVRAGRATIGGGAWPEGQGAAL